MDTKAFYLSRTFWGSVVMFASILAQAFGVTLGEGEQAAITDAIMQIVGGAGAILALWGARNASKSLTIK
jgi:uncharacterized membrane protein